jgi:hypothetical protein
MAASRLNVRTAREVPTGSISSTNFTLDASGDRAAIVFVADETMTATAILLRLGTITGTTPTYRVAIQGVDGSGNPDGSELSGSATTFSPSSLGWSANTNRWLTISGASITAGSRYAIVITYDSGTISGANNASFGMVQTAAYWLNSNLPYYLTDNSVGSYTKASGGTAWPYYGLRDSSSTFGGVLWSSIGSQAILSDGNRVCQKITWPTTWGQSITLYKMTVAAMTAPAGGSMIFGVWNAAGTAISSVTMDSDQTAGTASGRSFTASFTAPAVLTAGTTYYIGVERLGVNLGPRSFDHVDARDLESYSFGASSCLSTWNGSAWTDTTTSVLPMELHLSDITVASGGGNVFWIGG